jgi:hypothetical protein
MSIDEQLAADPAMLGQHQTDVEIHSECGNNSARVERVHRLA